jgi:hypothetical protein
VTYFKDNSNETDDNQTLKLSQLRQLLVKNLKSPTSAFKPKQSTWSVDGRFKGLFTQSDR